MSRPIVAWALVVPWSLWALIRLFGLERGYPLVPLMALTPYVVIVSLLAAAGVAVMRQWVPAALAALACIVLAVAVVPRLIPDGDPPIADPVKLEVLTANLHMSKADPDVLVSMVRDEDVDLLSVQELTPEGAEALRRSGIDRLLPHHVMSIREGDYGSALYSRYPMSRIGLSPGRFRQPEAIVHLPGAAFEAVCAHPYPPDSKANVKLWNDGIRSLPSARPDGGLRLLAGDFNATLDHDALRDLIGSGYRDAADAEGKGLAWTWSAYRAFPRVTIDHVLADRRIGISDYEVHRLPGSDHRAVSVRLTLPGTGSVIEPIAPTRVPNDMH